MYCKPTIEQKLLDFHPIDPSSFMSAIVGCGIIYDRPLYSTKVPEIDMINKIACADIELVWLAMTDLPVVIANFMI